MKEKGLTAVHWTLNPGDWEFAQSDPDHMVKFVQDTLPKSSLGQGEIILQHDIIERTAIKDQIKIIKLIKKKGRKIVPMRVCLGLKPFQEDN